LIASEFLVFESNDFHSTAFGQQSLFITHGIASGDVTNDSAIIWARANMQAQMHVEYDTQSTFVNSTTRTEQTSEQPFFVGHTKLEGLLPDTRYYYRVWFSAYDNINGSITSSPLEGSFQTAPDRHSAKPLINFVVSGDLGGENYCRRIIIGYSIFSVIKDTAPDFFLFNGDQIYADTPCSSQIGPKNVKGWHNIPQDIPSITNKTINWTNLTQVYYVYLQHWMYNRADTHLQNLLRNTSLYSQPDDHDVIDDYGGSWDYYKNKVDSRKGYNNLIKAGIDLFFNFSPIDKNTEDQPNRIYRSFNWGKDLDLFILDTRSNRSRNDLVDSPENSKTMLGKDQLRWLENGLLRSNATWKIISTSVPFTIPKCYSDKSGCDSWATNGDANKTFVTERSEFFRFLDDNNIKNVVFVATDVHFPSNVVINEDSNNDGDRLILYELISGPLSARVGDPKDNILIDPTINATFLYKEHSIFNFNHINIRSSPDDGKVHLISEIRDEDGILRPGSYLDLEPR
jgi:alkaline phosphatase D